MGLGAIVVPEGRHGTSTGAVANSAGAFVSEPLAYYDVLGRSTADRIIERFVRAEVERVSVLQRECGGSNWKPAFTEFENVEFQNVHDPYAAVPSKLKEYCTSGIDHAFLIFGNIYAETDVLDFFYFHRESRHVVTRSMNRDGLLDLWVVDCRKAKDTRLGDLLAEQESGASSYFIREYVNRIKGPAELRHFASDLLQGRCSARPAGREVKRGIWIDHGAEVHRQARIVAPAYVGRRSKVLQDTLITRCSAIEKDCCVDYGTVVEDSSILQNTDVGICLDVCHSVVAGNKMFHLDRNVTLEISDPAVMRSNKPPKPIKERKWARNVLLFSRRKQGQQAAVSLQPAASAPKQSRLEANSMKG